MTTNRREFIAGASRSRCRAHGDRFDFRAFNDAVVKTGGVPMVVLAREVDAFIDRR